MKVVDFKKGSKRSADTVTEQAYYWAAKLDGEPNQDELRQFREWLSADVEHQAEFKRVAAMWDGLDHYLSQLLSQVAADDSARAAANSAHQPVNGGGTPTPFFPFKGLATGACALAISLFIFLVKPFSLSGYEEAYTTEVGEIKQVDLPDGSDLQLNTNTYAEVKYENSARLVRLVAGEAHFNVAHQPDKPFVVYAGDFAVTAIGTAFSVYIREDRNVEVIVTEGTVELNEVKENVSQEAVSPLEQMQVEKTLGRFNKGQRTLLTDTLNVTEEKTEQELTKELSWRNGMLIFDNQPLSEVVEEVSRYTSTEIVVIDEAIRDMAIGGYFPAGKTSILLSTLEESFNISVNQVHPSLVELSLKSSGSQ